MMALEWAQSLVYLAAVLSRHATLLLSRDAGGGGLSYMGHIGMCRCEGYGFKQFTLR